MKYALAVEVKLVEQPDDDPPQIRPGSDPLQGAVQLMTGAIGRVAMPFQMPAGFDFRKSVEVRVKDFKALAEIIGRFDNLVQDIEAEKLECK